MDNQVDTEVIPETTPEKESPTSKPLQQQLGVSIVVAVLSALITSGAMMVAYDHFLAQKIVAVDIKGYILEQQSAFLAGKMTDEQLNQSFDKMEMAIKAIPKNKVVIMGDAVIQGVEKIEIQPKIK